MDKVVVVDEKDNIVGAIEKEEARQKGLIRRVVNVLLYDNKGRVFLQKRSKKRASHQLRWFFSAAGHVKENESYSQAAYRELEEEIGIVGLQLHKLDYYFLSKEEDQLGLPKYITIYVAEVADSVLTKINKEEVDSMKWFTTKKIKELQTKFPDMFTQDFINNISKLQKLLKDK